MTDEQLTLWPWIVLSTVAIIVSLGLAWRTRRFLAGATRGPGRVTRVTQERNEHWRGEGLGSETVITYVALVEFTPESGSRIEFRATGLHRAPRAGGAVTVAYDRDRPETTATIEDGVVWRPTVVATIVTVPLVLFTLSIVVGQYGYALWDGPIILPYLVAVALLAAVYGLLRQLPQGAARRSLYGFAAAMVLYGFSAFFAQMLGAMGLLTFIPSSTEWPVGAADHVAMDTDGNVIVPLMACGRVQVYDRTGRFVRGWFVQSYGGDFRVRTGSNGQVEVYTARGSAHIVYSRAGALLSHAKDTTGGFSRVVPEAELRRDFPFPWLLFPLTGPFWAWALMVAGGFAAQRLGKKPPAKV